MNMSENTFQDPRDQVTESEIHTISAIQRVSASLSLCGSLYIIREIVCKDPNRLKRSNIYHRIVFILSCFDTASSLALFVGSWVSPRDAGYAFLHHNYGNTATCDTQGFIITFCWLGVITSNSALCLNFLMTVKYNWPNAMLKQRIEKPFHAILLFFCLPLAASPLFWDLFNPGIGYCVLDVYPSGCYTSNDIECLRGDTGAYHILYIIAYGFPVPSAFLVITASMIMLYRSVKQQERQATQFASNATLQRLSKYSKIVFWRATWYVVSFLVVWFPSFVMLGTDYSIIAVQYFHKFTFPLQGTCNLVSIL